MFFMERDFACLKVENEFLDRLSVPLLFFALAFFHLMKH
jgi:hypothetical protein